MKLRTILGLAAAGLLVVAAPVQQTFAQDTGWTPTQPIRVIIPFGAGGSTDVFGRVAVSVMEQQTGWTLLVENKTGASGAIGTAEVQNAAPDGHTIGIASTTVFALDPFIPGATVPYGPEDFDYLGTMSLIGYKLVAAADAPFDDLKSLAEYSKTKPVSFTATGRSLELAMQDLGKQFGIASVAAPTSGSAESLQLVLGGHVDTTISGGVHVPFVVDGTIKVLAQLTDSRSAYAPDVGTVEEQGGTLPFRNYFLLFGPKGMDEAAKTAIVAAFDAAMHSEEVMEYAKTIHVDVKNLTPEEATADVTTQADKWRAHFAN